MSLEAGKGKERDSPPELPKETHTRGHIDFRTSDPPNYKIINLCGLKLLHSNRKPIHPSLPVNYLSSDLRSNVFFKTKLFN